MSAQHDICSALWVCDFGFWLQMIRRRHQDYHNRTVDFRVSRETIFMVRSSHAESAGWVPMVLGYLRTVHACFWKRFQIAFPSRNYWRNNFNARRRYESISVTISMRPLYTWIIIGHTQFCESQWWGHTLIVLNQMLLEQANDLTVGTSHRYSGTCSRCIGV